ncbi:MAG: hypothetical protein JWN48_4488 [Myxococcaceae bacterium]|nr:hypothetical protein [Myxococcaceae bacterium]
METWSIVCVLLLSSCSAGDAHVGDEKLTQSAMPVWKQRDQVRAFYSGHSLSDGVPEAVAQIAGSLGRSLEFEFQSVGYSLLRERTRGPDPKSEAWSGYKTGKNKVGEGLDVAQELASPTHLVPGAHYDVLVVTERHDLPEVAVHGQTATYLSDFAQRAWAANPDTDVFFYQTWMPLDVADPLPWVHYERAVRPLWECVASRVNKSLAPTAGRRVRVLPGASALADLVGELWRGSVPGLQHLTPPDRVRLLFQDAVHLSPLGTYFMGLVHYAVLFGQSPHGALGQPGIEVETAAHLQGLASRHAVTYGRIADAAASRDMASCRAFAAGEACALFYSYAGGTNPLAKLKHKAEAWRCGRQYAGADDPQNPFHD